MWTRSPLQQVCWAMLAHAGVQRATWGAVIFVACACARQVGTAVSQLH